MTKTHYSVEEIKTASISLTEGVGGSVHYEGADSVEMLLRNLSMFSEVILENGRIDGHHKDAEHVALLLDHQKEKQLAYAVFKAIIPKAPKKSNLFLRNEKALYISEALSPVKGKLGYVGVFRFAVLAAHFNDVPLAIALLLLIAENIPVECTPINLQDTRFASLRILKKLGIETVCNGTEIDTAIKEADSATY